MRSSRFSTAVRQPKVKAQRFDAMMEQLDIRKAEVSQRILRLKSEEAILESDREKAQKQYDAVTNVIQSTNAECVRLDEEIHQIQEEMKGTEFSDGNRTNCISQGGIPSGISPQHYREV